MRSPHLGLCETSELKSQIVILFLLLLLDLLLHLLLHLAGLCVVPVELVLLVLLVEQVLLVSLLIFLVVPVYASVVIVEVKAFKSLKYVLALDGAPTGLFRVVKGLTGYEQNELSHDLLDGLDTFL